jgi:cell division protein FtsL
VASWAAGAATVEAPRARPRRAPQPAKRAAAKPRTRAAAKRRPFAGGVVWIFLIGVLLAGVVAVNVAVLQANVQLDRLGRERVQLRADNASLSARLSSAGAAARIETEARQRLGLVPANPDTTSYVQLAK